VQKLNTQNSGTSVLSTGTGTETFSMEEPCPLLAGQRISKYE